MTTQEELIKKLIELNEKLLKDKEEEKERQNKILENQEKIMEEQKKLSLEIKDLSTFRSETKKNLDKINDQIEKYIDDNEENSEKFIELLSNKGKETRLPHSTKEMKGKEEPSEGIKENLIQSKVLNSIEELNLIKSWMELGDNLKFELVWSAKIHGDSAKTFHAMVEDKTPTLTLIKAKGGLRIGGFTNSLWNSSRRLKVDKETFIFDLNKKEKYHQNPESTYSTYCYKKCGPIFGCGNVIYIYDNCLSSKENYYYPHEGTFDMPNGDEIIFTPDEVEVFQVEEI